MKNLFYWIAIATIFTSCKGPDIELPKTPVSEIFIDKAELVQSFSAEATEKTIPVWSDYKWQYEKDDQDTWLFVEDYPTDRKLYVKISTNRDFRPRKSKIRLFNNTQSKTIDITQNGSTEYISPFADDLITRPHISNNNIILDKSGTKEYSHSIETSIDFSPDTYFLTTFPENDYVEVRYVPEMTIIPYKWMYFVAPQQIKDRPFSRLEILYNTKQNKEFIPYIDTVLTQRSNAPFIVAYPPETVKEILCRMHSTEIDGKHTVGLAEFSITTDMVRPDYYKPFTDETCTELEPGTTLGHIKQLSPLNKLIANMAYYTFEDKYPAERIQYFPATEAVSEPSYNLPNPTGLYFKETKSYAIFVGDTHGRDISLRIVNMDDPIRVRDYSYPLHKGCNIITLDFKNSGWGFIRYEKLSDEEYPDILINLATGDDRIRF